MRNKGFLQNNDIITLIVNNGIIKDESEIAKEFNNYDVNIVKKSIGIKQSKNNNEILKNIVQLYDNYPSLIQIRNHINNQELEKFSFKPINLNDIKKVLQNTNTKNVVRTDTIPLKLLKIAWDFLASHLLNAVNISMRWSTFHEYEKVASVISLNKSKPNKSDISNFWLINVNEPEKKTRWKLPEETFSVMWPLFNS